MAGDRNRALRRPPSLTGRRAFLCPRRRTKKARSEDPPRDERAFICGRIRDHLAGWQDEILKATARLQRTACIMICAAYEDACAKVGPISLIRSRGRRTKLHGARVFLLDTYNVRDSQRELCHSAVTGNLAVFVCGRSGAERSPSPFRSPNRAHHRLRRVVGFFALGAKKARSDPPQDERASSLLPRKWDIN